MTFWLLDAGHGGIIGGHYLTPGKRSPEVPPGIYEGEFNRKVCELLEKRSAPEMPITCLTSGPCNVSLATRVSTVNQFYRREKDCVLISIHANASPASSWGSANGYAVFHSKNASNRSRKVAGDLFFHMADTGITARRIKESAFTIVRKTKCPAVLLECGFMTNKKDAAFLASLRGPLKIADAIFETMIQNNK